MTISLLFNFELYFGARGVVFLKDYLHERQTLLVLLVYSGWRSRRSEPDPKQVISKHNKTCRPSGGGQGKMRLDDLIMVS